MFSKTLYFSVFTSLILSSINVFADFVMVANADAPVDSISVKGLRYLYLKKKLYLYEGQVATVTGLEKGPARDSFCADVLRKSEATLNSYWSRLIFTGRASPPRLYSDENALLEFVAKTPGAIAYVGENTTLIDGVKLLEVN